MEDKYLPIGTVVTLKGEPKKIVIVGYGAFNTEDKKIYDYCAYSYPEGYLWEENIVFNHDAIYQINHFGYKEGFDEFNQSLTEMISEFKNSSKEV